jgi:hypothetical protein
MEHCSGYFFCWAIWKARNKICFDKKPLKEPIDIVLFCLCFYALLGRALFGGGSGDDPGWSGDYDAHGCAADEEESSTYCTIADRRRTI